VFDSSFDIVSCAQLEHKQITPCPGWCEHDPEEIVAVVRRLFDIVAADLATKGIAIDKVRAIGLTNQVALRFLLSCMRVVFHFF